MLANTARLLAWPAVAAASLAIGAAPFPVEVETRMNGLDIEVLASSGTPLVVTFASKASVDARCTARISSGRDTPRERTVTVKAGKSGAATFKVSSAPNVVRVEASCEPAAAKR